MLRERFIVTLKSGDTFDGLLDDHDESTVELLDPHVVGTDGKLTGVDGRMYLPRAEIAYMQRPESP
jgi:hypothetical protein